MFANLFNEFRGKCFYPIFRGFLAWAGAQTTKQQNPRWVQQLGLYLVPIPRDFMGLGCCPIKSHEIEISHGTAPVGYPTGFPLGYPGIGGLGLGVEVPNYLGGLGASPPKISGSPISVHQSWALNLVFLLNYQD
jgi:hypothetical protein